MKNLKTCCLLLLTTILFFTSCQKGTIENEFAQTVEEQSEVIPSTPDDLLQQKEQVAPSEKQLKTSGMKSYVDLADRTPSERQAPTTANARNATWISCGKSINSSTIGATNTHNGGIYTEGCLTEVYDFSAGDRKFLLRVTNTTSVKFNLSGMSKDLDIFVFSAYEPDYYPNTCIGHSINGGTREENLTRTLNPGTYVIIIDGYNRSQHSNFRLRVDCGDQGGGGGTSANCEDFDNYYNGDISRQSSKWKKWITNARFDGEIRSNRSYSSSKSLYIDHKSGYSASNQPDVIRKVGDYASGRYLVKWKIYVPSNRNAAFNIQKYNQQGDETGMMVYFRQGRGIALQANNQIYQARKSYRQGRWIDVYVDYDLSNRTAYLTIDNELIAIWDTRIKYNSSRKGANRLSGINFWAYHSATSFYVDDFCAEDISGVVIDYFDTDGAIFID